METEVNPIAEILKAIITKIVAAGIGEENAIAGKGTVGGALPKPATQQITDEYLIWEWFPFESSDQVVITAELNRSTKEWNVGLRCIRQMTMNADEARLLGEALLSAYEWKTTWKLHFADMMMGEMDSVLPSPSPEPFFINGTEDETNPSFDV
jgi:hypothetical protein